MAISWLRELLLRKKRQMAELGKPQTYLDRKRAHDASSNKALFRKNPEPRLRQRLIASESYIKCLTTLDISDSDVTATKLGVFTKRFEEIALRKIVQACEPAPGEVFLEIGCGDNGGNCLAATLYTTVQQVHIDADEDSLKILRLAVKLAGIESRVKVENKFIDAENIEDILTQIPGSLYYLGVDVDGMDFHILAKAVSREPKVVFVEYNPFFGPNKAVSVAYRPKFNRKERRNSKLLFPKGYYGASYQLLLRFMEGHGYNFVGVIRNGSNMAFTRFEVPADELLFSKIMTVNQKYNERFSDVHGSLMAHMSRAPSEYYFHS